MGDLLNPVPSTLVLTNVRLLGAASETKTRGMSEGRPLVGGSFDYSRGREDWLQNGYGLFKKESGGTTGIYGSANRWGMVIKVSTRPPHCGLVQIK